MAGPAGTTFGALTALERIGRAPYGAAFVRALGQLVGDAAVARSRPLERRPWQPDELWSLLEEQPERFDLFAAMRLIAGTYPDFPAIGTSRRIGEDAARFGQEVSLGFAAATVTGADAPREQRPGRLRQAAIGLFGPNGALPLHLTEYALQRRRHERDHSFAAFADVFHHRMLSLFYRAWAINHPIAQLDRPEQDIFGRIVASLCGMGQSALIHRDGVSDLAKWAHAGSLARQVRNPEGLKELLVDYFGIDVQIHNWVGFWMHIPADQQTRLGAANGFGQLGVESIAGESVWDVQTSFRIVVGPLSRERYLDFLPSGRSLARMMALTRLYVGDALRFEIQLVLANKEVPLSWLGNDVKLGWTSWLGVRATDAPAADYVAVQ
jgi:type VI secretion system protein ImpH